MAISKHMWFPVNFFEREDITAYETLLPEDIRDKGLVFFLELLLNSKKKIPRDRFYIAENYEMDVHTWSLFFNITEDKFVIFTELLEELNLIKVYPSYIQIFEPWKEPQRDRNTPEYTQWRTAVFERDKYTCRICNDIGGSLEAHHIIRWADEPGLRFDVNNGITLCTTCHKKVHKGEVSINAI